MIIDMMNNMASSVVRRPSSCLAFECGVHDSTSEMNWGKNIIMELYDHDLMEGISFVTDINGKRIAVQLDLEKYGALWEDIFDGLIARERAREPKSSLAAVRGRLRRHGKLSGKMRNTV